MVLYHNHKTLTIRDKRQLERLKKRKLRNLILHGIGTLCLTVAFANAIRLFDMNEKDLMSESVLSQLNFSSIIPQVNTILDEEVVETKSEVEQYFDYYCSIYQVDKDIVYQKAQELTNSFTNTEWVFNHNVPGTKVIGQERSYASQELGVLAFVRHMKQIPTDFGFTKEELATNQTYSLDITYEKFTEKQSSLFGNLDSTLCQAIQYHETGYYTSPIFLEYNNVAGLIDKSTNDYWQFRNPAEGILELLVQLEYNFCNTNGFGNLPIEEQITLIQPTFCPAEDKRDAQNLNPNWIPGVTNLYYQLSSEKQISSSSK